MGYKNLILLSLFLLNMNGSLFAMEASGAPAYAPGYDLTRDESDLIWLASKNDLDKVCTLAERVDLNVKNKKGTTALHWAASRGYGQMVELLLKKGARVDVRDKTRKTPLQWAAGFGHKDIVELLLAHNADPDLLDDKGDSALHWAVYNKNNDCVQLLLDHSAEINEKNNEGITPLNNSLIVGNSMATELLLERNAQMMSDKKNRNPLYCAVWGNNPACLQALLKHLSPTQITTYINQPDNEGETVLHNVAQMGNARLAALFMQHGADINKKCYLKQRTPLQVCMRNYEKSFVHADSRDEYRRKKEARLSTDRVIEFIRVLKQDPQLDTHALDEYGLSVYDYIDKNRYDSEEERDALVQALSKDVHGSRS